MGYKEMVVELCLECIDSIDDMNAEIFRKVRDVAMQILGRVKGKRKRNVTRCVWMNDNIKLARNKYKVKNKGAGSSMRYL